MLSAAQLQQSCAAQLQQSSTAAVPPQPLPYASLPLRSSLARRVAVMSRWRDDRQHARGHQQHARGHRQHARGHRQHARGHLSCCCAASTAPLTPCSRDACSAESSVPGYALFAPPTPCAACSAPLLWGTCLMRLMRYGALVSVGSRLHSVGSAATQQNAIRVQGQEAAGVNSGTAPAWRTLRGRL